MPQTSARLARARFAAREATVDTRVARWTGAVALFAAATWLAISLADDHHHPDWHAGDRLALVGDHPGGGGNVRAWHLPGPTGHRRAPAVVGTAVIGGLAMHVLFSAPLGNVVIATAGLVLMWPTGARPEPDALPQVWARQDDPRSDPLAPFAMQSLKSYHFSCNRHAAIAYRTRMGFAVVSGDPVGDQTEFGTAGSQFRRDVSIARLADRRARL